MSIERLSNLPDFEVAGQTRDIRGWHLFDLEGLEVGTVEDLIIDTDKGNVCEALLHAEGRDVVVSIDALKLDEHDHRASVGVARAQLRAMPPYPASWHPLGHWNREIGVLSEKEEHS